MIKMLEVVVIMIIIIIITIIMSPTVFCSLRKLNAVGIWQKKQ
jgi:hypothetical protein